MSNTWKLSILNFLNDENEKHLKDTLRKNWFDYYPEEKIEIFHFLFKAKQNKLFLYFFAIDLQSQIIDLPWIPFFTILKDSHIALPDAHFQEIIKSFRKQKIISSKAFTLEQVIKEFLSKKRFRFLQRLTQYKQELIASARIAESERLMDQHMEYMNILKKISPSEFRIKGLITDQEKRKAERILRNRVNRTPESNSESPELNNEEEIALLKQINKQAKKFLKTQQALPSDFAYLFRSFGENKMAVEFIYKNKDFIKKDWQLLDYLFNGKQYVELLDHCQLLKQKYSEKPDALFSISYAESIAYWELGEKERAFDLMKQISSMRPNFKSASETLAQWKEDGFE